MIDLVVKIDHRLGERKGEKSKTPKLIFLKSDKRTTEGKICEDSDPMQIGGIRGPVAKEEKDKRRKLNLCLYCGKPGHFAKDCPVKPKVERLLLLSNLLTISIRKTKFLVGGWNRSNEAPKQLGST